MLAVVQHEQCGTGTERGRDAAEDVGCDATHRGAPLTHPEHRRDLADHVVIGGDAGERDDVHDPLLRLAANGMCETRLAQTTGTDDRGDTGRTQQVRHRGDVIAATEQRVGLMRDTMPCRGRRRLQQLLVRGLEWGAGIGAELVAERTTVSLIPGQRRRRSQCRGFTVQQLQQQLLVARTVTDKVA